MTRQEIVRAMVRSWQTEDSSVCPTEEILQWVEDRNHTTCTEIRRVPLAEVEGWYYDREEGTIRNRAGTFFKVAGLRAWEGDRTVWEHPILLQQEIGYLGMLCREIGGVLHFLMQAKIEPGNVNQVQLSPTIQATRSNFTRAHGGRTPAYLDTFLNARPECILLDQLQSEQSSRFLKKRNRNMIVLAEGDVEELPSHRWMTLGQIKALMCTRDNLVNMDTRTVLSGIPFCAGQPEPELAEAFRDSAFYRSVFAGSRRWDIPAVYQAVNNDRMFADRRQELVPLHTLKNWVMDEWGVEGPGNFRVIGCQIEIDGREVRRWCQPMLEALSPYTFGLICCDADSVRHFLVRVLPEAGCFDGVELGPSVQRNERDGQSGVFDSLLEDPEAEVFCDIMLSEEGGRFYHDSNRNRIVRLPRERLGELPAGWFLLDYRTLNSLCQINNCLNIQLRNLLSLLRTGDGGPIGGGAS